MKALFLSATLLALALVSPAQETDEARITAAGKLIETMGIKDDMAVGFKAAMQPMLEPMIQQMGLNEVQVVELNALFTDWWENDIDQDSILGQFKSLYAETFTAEELTELELFYQTPLGRKLILTLPDLTQKGMQIGMTAAQEKQGELMAKVQAFQERVKKENAPEEEPAAEGE